jgi:hypothetical protein
MRLAYLHLMGYLRIDKHEVQRPPGERNVQIVEEGSGSSWWRGRIVFISIVFRNINMFCVS